jgi:hypothetical protein
MLMDLGRDNVNDAFDVATFFALFCSTSCSFFYEFVLCDDLVFVVQYSSSEGV